MDRAAQHAQAAADSAAASEAAKHAALTAEVDAWGRARLAEWCRQMGMAIPSHPKMETRYYQAAGDAPRSFYVTYTWTEQRINFSAQATCDSDVPSEARAYSFSVGLYLNGHEKYIPTNTIEELGVAILKIRERKDLARRDRPWPFSRWP